jgi:hypothetical protein
MLVSIAITTRVGFDVIDPASAVGDVLGCDVCAVASDRRASSHVLQMQALLMKRMLAMLKAVRPPIAVVCFLSCCPAWAFDTPNTYVLLTTNGTSHCGKRCRRGHRSVQFPRDVTANLR